MNNTLNETIDPKHLSDDEMNEEDKKNEQRIIIADEKNLSQTLNLNEDFKVYKSFQKDKQNGDNLSPIIKVWYCHLKKGQKKHKS